MDIEALLQTMTLEEKASLLAGSSHWETMSIDRLGVGAAMMSDGPHGLRHQIGDADHLGINESLPATCYPTASALACSFDTNLVREIGSMLAREARTQGVDVVLGPGINMKRSPLCGRNFEYFTEDPYLSGELGSAMVEGIQSQGVGACLKHFAANNQEHARLVSDSVVDEQALREIYLAPFERVVSKAHPWSIMTGYNKLNGTYCSQNEWLLTNVLRNEWGFEGVCISDWGAMSDGVSSIRAGLDICMPGPRADLAASVVDAVKQGELDEAVVNAAAARVLAFVDASTSQKADPCKTTTPTVDEESLVLSRWAATKSAVLLENNGLLPLNRGQRVAVIGAFAKEPRYQGAGSSKINPCELDCAWDALTEEGVAATYAPGYDVSTGDTTREMLDEAADAARKADVVVLFAGLPDRYESEGFDRKLMVMPRGHRMLIERVCEANASTVVVLQGGAPMEMPWRHMPAAILLMYLSGCQGGHAAVDVLMGRANPCGKLAETWPAALEDTALGASFPEFDREVYYREGLFVGYRYFDAVGVAPAYPFGHGLSYTTFQYGEASVRREDGRVVVSCAIANKGAMAGEEVVQVYLAAPASNRPRVPRRLVGFAKVGLEPGDSCCVEIPLDGDSFRTWNALDHRWEVDAGEYTLMVGASSRDIKGEVPFEVVAHDSAWLGYPVVDAIKCESAPLAYLEPAAHGFTQESFEKLYAKELPPRSPIAPFTIDSSASEMASTWFGRLVFRVVDHILKEPASEMDEDTRVMMNEIVSDTPLRSLILSGFSMRSVEGLVDMLNGRYLRGLTRMVGTIQRVKKTLEAHVKHE